LPFVVLEGLDGAGGETQTKLLKDYFIKNNIPSIFVRSPDYDHPIGKFICDYLEGKFELTNDQAFLAFAIDVLNSVPRIKTGLRDKKIVIADRYITSTIAYHCSRGFSFQNAIDVVKRLDFPRANRIIFIDIKPETSMKRKIEENKKLDKYEKDLESLRKVREFYLKEIKENVLGKWVVIDGERSKKDIHQDILKVINSLE